MEKVRKGARAVTESDNFGARLITLMLDVGFLT